MKIITGFRRTLLASTLVLIGSALPATALQGPSPGERLQAARAHWQTLSEEEQATLRRRFEGFRKLDEDARHEMHDRASRLGRFREQWGHRPPEELREQLHGLEPSERREAMRGHMKDRMADRGRRIRDKLPTELRRKLEQAPPGEREEILRSFHRKHRRTEADRVLEEMRERMDLSPEEVHHLESLPVDERVASMMELRRRFLTDRIERRGPPPFIEKGDWEAWKLLPTDQFFEHWHRQMPNGPRHRRPDGSESGDRWDAVREAMRPRPSWMRELAGLPEAERRAEIHRRVRPRILNALRRAGVPEDELQAMEGLDPESFREQLHRTLPREEHGARRPRGRHSEGLERPGGPDRRGRRGQSPSGERGKQPGQRDA